MFSCHSNNRGTTRQKPILNKELREREEMGRFQFEVWRRGKSPFYLLPTPVKFEVFLKPKTRQWVHPAGNFCVGGRSTELRNSPEAGIFSHKIFFCNMLDDRNSYLICANMLMRLLHTPTKSPISIYQKRPSKYMLILVLHELY